MATGACAGTAWYGKHVGMLACGLLRRLCEHIAPFTGALAPSTVHHHNSVKLTSERKQLKRALGRAHTFAHHKIGH